MRNLDEILNNANKKKNKIPHSFTNTIFNFSPDTIENRRGIMKFNFKKQIAVACMGLVLISGTAFAANIVYEKIWKDPKKIEVITTEPTQEAKKENITEEEAKQIAIDKLNQIGFNDTIIKTDSYKEIDSDKIMYRFYTEDNYTITIDGKKAEFFDIWNESKKLTEIDKNFYGRDSSKNLSSEYFMNRDKAVEIANKYYKLFGFKDGEYEVTNVDSFNGYGDNTAETGYKFNVTFNKKYGDIYNPYEYIAIQVYAKDEMLWMLRTGNISFDNNPTEITKEKAIEIAVEEDKKIEDSNIIRTNVELRVVKMNGNAYSRAVDKEAYYKPTVTTDVSMEEMQYYETDERVRNAWVVVITYAEYEASETSVVDRYAKGQFSYFVDATTGEIIGGENGDYISYN